MAFGFGASKSKSKSVTQIDAALRPIRGEILGQSMGLARQPLQQYQGERVAGFSQPQQQAMGAISGLGGSGQQLAQRGFDILGGLGTADQRIGAYMNPFTQEVIDRSMTDLERQRQIQGGADAASAVAARAFGGSRQAVQDALTNEAFARQAGDLSSQLRYQGFNTALGAAQQDVGQQQALAQALQQAGYGALQGQLGVGGAQQQQTQAELDAAREQFYEPKNQQMQLLDFLTGIASGVPQGSSTKGSGSSLSLSGSFK